MGIKPISGSATPIPADDANGRWGQWVDDLDGAGSVASDVFAQTHALALSSNAWIEEDGYGLATGIGDSLDEARRAMELTEATWEEMVTMRDNAQDQAINLLAEVQELQMKTSSHMLMSRNGVMVENDHFRIVQSGSLWRVEKKGSWAGTAVAMGRQEHRHRGGDSSWTTYDPSGDLWNLDPMVSSSWNTQFLSAWDIVIFYNVQPGQARNQEYTLSGGTAGGEWATVQTVTTDAGGPVTMNALMRVAWGAADRGVTYGIRVLVNGVIAGSLTQSGLGPLTPLGSGVVSQSKEWQFTVPAGGELQFQVFANPGNASQRSFNSGFVKLVWSE